MEASVRTFRDSTSFIHAGLSVTPRRIHSGRAGAPSRSPLVRPGEGKHYFCRTEVLIIGGDIVVARLQRPSNEIEDRFGNGSSQRFRLGSGEKITVGEARQLSVNELRAGDARTI